MGFFKNIASAAVNLAKASPEVRNAAFTEMKRTKEAQAEFVECWRQMFPRDNFMKLHPDIHGTLLRERLMGREIVDIVIDFTRVLMACDRNYDKVVAVYKTKRAEIEPVFLKHQIERNFS